MTTTRDIKRQDILKAAMELAGYHGGSVRAPLHAPDERQREEIALLLNAVQEKMANFETA